MTPIWVVMGINLILFIVYSIERDLILYHLGLIPIIIAHKPWTIITSIFLHGGIWHIMANMITLYFLGGNVIGLLGGKRFLLVYFMGGIIGSLLYLLLGDPYIPAIGASGAVFALGGVLAVMRPKIRVIIFPLPVPVPLWVAVVGVFLVIGVIFSIFIFPGVAWQAHLGGLAWGLAIGYFFRKRERAYYYR